MFLHAYIYPVGFAVGVKTSKYGFSNEKYASIKSAMTTFTNVSDKSGSNLKILLSGYPLSQDSRRENFGWRASSCDPGTEWRYTKDGMPLTFACNCPTNSLCSGQTSCYVTPVAGDSWLVVAVDTSLCSTSTAPDIPTINIPSTSKDDTLLRLILGLCLGLSLGLVLLACLGYIFMKRVLVKSQLQIEKVEEVTLPELGPPLPALGLPAVVHPVYIATELVFPSNLAMDATRSPQVPRDFLVSLQQPTFVADNMELFENSNTLYKDNLPCIQVPRLSGFDEPCDFYNISLQLPQQGYCLCGLGP